MVLSLSRWVGKVAVVTGASDGIGAIVAERLVERGIIVVGLARRSGKIDEIAKRHTGKMGRLYAYKTDLSKEEDILKAFKWIKENVGPIAILINNAAVLLEATPVNNTTEQLNATFDLNVIGLSIATREAITSMKENHINGHIININSVVGHKVISPHVYSPSKFAVTALTETLRLELNALKSKIKVTSLSPGVVETPMFRGFTSNLSPELVPTARLQPEDVADGIIYVLSTRPHVQIQELTIKPVGETI